MKFRCLRCLREKFTKKGPHICKGEFRKRNIKWEEVVDLNPATEKVEDERERV